MLPSGRPDQGPEDERTGPEHEARVAGDTEHDQEDGQRFGGHHRPPRGARWRSSWTRTSASRCRRFRFTRTFGRRPAKQASWSTGRLAQRRFETASPGKDIATGRSSPTPLTSGPTAPRARPAREGRLTRTVPCSRYRTSNRSVSVTSKTPPASTVATNRMPGSPPSRSGGGSSFGASAVGAVVSVGEPPARAVGLCSGPALVAVGVVPAAGAAGGTPPAGAVRAPEGA